VARRQTTGEPAFGSDSFLDVTANLVGVLIILIVLVGLRVAKAPPRAAAVDAERAKQLAAAREGLSELNVERRNLERQLATLRQSMAAKQAAAAELESTSPQLASVVRALRDEVQNERNELAAQQAELLAAQSRLVSLGEDIERAKAGRIATAERLEHRSPVSQRVEMEELHLELQADRVAFIDLAALMERAKGKSRAMEPDLRARGRATAEVGPVAGFRLKFTLAREDMPFTQSLLYGSSSFRARLTEWQLNPTDDPRGEPLDAALEPDSELESLLARQSPNKYSVTIWTYADSFTAFRRLCDHLTARGYNVAARPLPIAIPIRGSLYGSRSFSQ
jgi:hypothetical protein